MLTAAVILAAGASTRLGEPKQLITIHGETLLARTMRTAQEAGVDHIFVVLGANAEKFRDAYRDAPPLDLTFVVNPDWQSGMASSVRAGVQAAKDLDRILLLICDQPAVTPLHLLQLMMAGRNAESIAASTYGGRTGVPALFPRAYYPELRALEGDSGARSLLQKHKQNVVELPLENGELDCDTPELLAAIRGIWTA